MLPPAAPRALRRRSRALAVVAGGLALCLAACSGPQDGARTTTTRASVDGSTSSTAPAAPARLEPSPCPDPGTAIAHITCTTLVLPEDRAHPDGRQVELPVLRFGRRDEPAPTGPAEDPIVYLHGGPGEGAVDTWGTWATLADGLDRELVVYDQRGGGAATPRLDCPEHTEAMQEVVGSAATWAQDRQVVADSMRACASRLRDEGIDLDQYDTPTSTQDLEDLRVALGADTMTLVGVSYGSRLALDYLRTHPDRVSSLVLDAVDAPGTSGPRVERALPAAAIARLVDACAADPACATAHPDLGSRLDQVVQTFDAAPHAATLDGREVRVTGEEIYAAVFTGLYDTDLVPIIPQLIDLLAAGDTGVVDLVLQRNGADLIGATSGAFGAMASINCADLGAPDAEDERARTTDPGAAGTIVLASTDSFCDAWPVDPVPESFLLPGTDPAAAVPNPPPTLVVTGELDPITPAAGARRIAEALRATYVEVPRGGHAPLLSDRCARAVLRSFLADASAPDLSCTVEAVPAPFA